MRNWQVATLRRYSASSAARRRQRHSYSSAPPKLVDEFAGKIEELVECPHGKLRADVVHEKSVAMGFKGNERTAERVCRQRQSTPSPGRR